MKVLFRGWHSFGGTLFKEGGRYGLKMSQGRHIRLSWLSDGGYSVCFSTTVTVWMSMIYDVMICEGWTNFMQSQVISFTNQHPAEVEYLGPFTLPTKAKPPMLFDVLVGNEKQLACWTGSLRTKAWGKNVSDEISWCLELGYQLRVIDATIWGQFKPVSSWTQILGTCCKFAFQVNVRYSCWAGECFKGTNLKGSYTFQQRFQLKKPTFVEHVPLEDKLI